MLLFCLTWDADGGLCGPPPGPSKPLAAAHLDEAVLQEWNRVLAEDDKVWDQNAFNDLFRLNIEVNSPSTGLRTFM